MMKFPTFLRSFETFHHCKILCHWDPCHKFQTILAVGGMCQHKQQNEMSKPSMVPWTWIWDSLSLPFDSGLLGHQQSYVWQFEGPRMDVSLILLVTSQGMKPLNFEFCAGVWTVTQLAVCAKGKKIRCQYRRSGIGDRHTKVAQVPSDWWGVISSIIQVLNLKTRAVLKQVSTQIIHPVEESLHLSAQKTGHQPQLVTSSELPRKSAKSLARASAGSSLEIPAVTKQGIEHGRKALNDHSVQIQLRLWLTETKYHVTINPPKMTIATMNHVTNPVWQEVPWHLQAKAPGCLRCSPHQTQGQTLRIWEAQAQGLKGEDMEGPWKAPLSTRFWSHAVVPVVFARKWRMRPLSSGRGFYLLRYPG